MLVKFWWFYDSLTSPLAVSVAWTMMITVVISLVFDFRDYIAWRRGARDPIGAKDIQRG